MECSLASRGGILCIGEDGDIVHQAVYQEAITRGRVRHANVHNGVVGSQTGTQRPLPNEASLSSQRQEEPENKARGSPAPHGCNSVEETRNHQRTANESVTRKAKRSCQRSKSEGTVAAFQQQEMDLTMCAVCGRTLSQHRDPGVGRVLLDALHVHAHTKGCTFHPTVCSKLMLRLKTDAADIDVERKQAEDVVLELMVPQTITRVFEKETASLSGFCEWVERPEVKCIPVRLCAHCSKRLLRPPSVRNQSAMCGHLCDEAGFHVLDSDEEEELEMANQPDFDKVEYAVLNSANRLATHPRRPDVRRAMTISRMPKEEKIFHKETLPQIREQLRRRTRARMKAARRREVRSAQTRESIRRAQRNTRSKLRLPPVRGAG